MCVVRFWFPVESCYDRLFSNDVGNSPLSDEDDGSGSDFMMGFEVGIERTRCEQIGHFNCFFFGSYFVLLLACFSLTTQAGPNMPLTKALNSAFREKIATQQVRSVLCYIFAVCYSFLFQF